MTTRRVLWGSSALITYVIAYALACALLPEGSSTLTSVSDIGFVCLEFGVLVLCAVAIFRTVDSRGKWVWRLVALWVALNIVAEADTRPRQAAAISR